MEDGGPVVVALLALGLGVQNHDGDVVDDLKDQHDGDDPPLSVVEVGLDEGPARSKEKNDGEQEGALDEGYGVVHGGPELSVAGDLNIVVPHRLEQDAQGFDHKEGAHEHVDRDDPGSGPAQDAHPYHREDSVTDAE